MRSYNQIQIVGNVGQEPEMRYLPNGTAVVNLPVATSRKYKNDAGTMVEATEWHNVVAYGKLAEIINDKLSKGELIFVTGRMTYRTWDGQDGAKHHKAEIIAHDCVFLYHTPVEKVENSENAGTMEDVIPG